MLIRVETNKFVAGVEVNEDNDIIINTAPILKKFKGQKIQNLSNWIKSIGGTTSIVIPTTLPDELTFEG